MRLDAVEIIGAIIAGLALMVGAYLFFV